MEFPSVLADRDAQEGIIPAWEDEANKNGGKWSIQLPKDKNRNNVDKMWLYTVSESWLHRLFVKGANAILPRCLLRSGRRSTRRQRLRKALARHR